jgi:hypothetical protein
MLTVSDVAYICTANLRHTNIAVLFYTTYAKQRNPRQVFLLSPALPSEWIITDSYNPQIIFEYYEDSMKTVSQRKPFMAEIALVWSNIVQLPPPRN